jgi:membrane-associated phospholipid phosphatase
MVPLAAALLLLAAAEESAPPVAPRGIFLGQEHRYRPGGPLLWAKGLVVRSFSDLLAMPASLGGERPVEWVPFAAGTAATAVALVPIEGRSADARFQDAIHAWRGVNCVNAPATTSLCPAPPSGFHLWTPTTNVVFAATEVGIPLTLLLVGAFGDHPQLLESATLAIEAWSVAQMYHVGIKVLVGREAVLWGNGAGAFHGPSVASFPDGFPSGHAASLFAILGTYATYFDEPWLTALLLGVGATLATGLVLDDYHYAAEVLWGGAMGFLVGRWVVRHRSTRFAYDARGQAVRLETIAPLAVPGGGGLAARFTF